MEGQTYNQRAKSRLDIRILQISDRDSMHKLTVYIMHSHVIRRPRCKGVYMCVFQFFWIWFCVMMILMRIAVECVCALMQLKWSFCRLWNGFWKGCVTIRIWAKSSCGRSWVESTPESCVHPVSSTCKHTWFWLAFVSIWMLVKCQMHIMLWCKRASEGQSGSGASEKPTTSSTIVPTY